MEPARFYVQVEKRTKLACPRCKEGVAVAPASQTPLPGALPAQTWPVRVPPPPDGLASS